MTDDLILVTGSAGHLGEAIMRTLQASGRRARGIDINASAFTNAVGSITDDTFVRSQLRDVTAVIHCATLHKPHVGTHSAREFIDTNITGTLVLLEESVLAGVQAFVYTSTTSAFGSALSPPAGQPAAWVTESTTPIPRNIYGVTKAAAESVCELFHRREAMPVIILRTARFFPEPDDDPAVRSAYAAANVQVNELLYRRADIEDVVSAHLLAVERAPSIGFGRYIISATTPFSRHDLLDLRQAMPDVVRRYVPDFDAVYAARGWRMFAGLDRVYVNDLARRELGWQPTYDFAHAIARLRAGHDHRSELAQTIGAKGYHPEELANGMYPFKA
ncbi:MAG TPA: NAD(P)-dependent oxidoreductase [Gemmatimonadaceae bacterium]|jgi:UDP-glucose 4-epimerase